MSKRKSSSEYDYSKGASDAMRFLSSSPQDPKLLGNDTQMILQFCYPLVKDSLK